MGQKINPYGFRLGVTTDWKSRWFSEREYKEYLTEDWKIREAIMTQAGVGGDQPHRDRAHPRQGPRRHPHRPSGHRHRSSWRPGRRAARAASPRSPATPRCSSTSSRSRAPSSTPRSIAQGVADQLANRIAFRRAMKRAVQNAQRAGALGIRVQCSGRLGGAEMSRTEWYREGRVPLHTLRADIDYGFREATHHERPRRRQGVALQGRHPALQAHQRRQDRPRGGDGRRRDVRSAGEPRRVVSSAARRPDAGRARDRSRCSRKPIPSSRSCSTRKKRSLAAPTTGTRRRTSVGRTDPHVDAPQGRTPQAPPRPHQAA